MEGSPNSSLRDRKKRAVRDAAAEAALTLFAAQGYDATTIDEIATQAGMSARTFFRYFATKDELITHTFATLGDDVVTNLSLRPAHEGTWGALRRAFDVVVTRLESDAGGIVIMRIIYDTPNLYAKHLEKQARWRRSIGSALLKRRATSLSGRLEAEAIAGAAIACLEAARVEWVRRDGAIQLAAMIDEAMGALLPTVELELQDGGTRG